MEVREELDEGSQRHKLAVIRQINTKDIMYNMINITLLYIICYIRESLRE